MKRDSKLYILSCLIYLLDKYELPFLIVFRKTYRWIFSNRLPKSSGFDTILVVLDRLNTYTYNHFIPLAHPFTTKGVATLFWKNIVRLHAMPCSILSIKDAIFVSKFRQELFHFSQTQLRMGTSYHPQSYLWCFSHERPSS